MNPNHLFNMIILQCLLGVVPLSAQSVLRLTETSSAHHDFDLLTHEIRFSALGDIEIHPASGTSSTFGFATVKEITFTDSPNAVQQPQANGILNCVITDDRLRIVGVIDDRPQTLIIYSSTGAVMTRFEQSLAEPISISSLPRGIYILQTHQQTIKFMR